MNRQKSIPMKFDRGNENLCNILSPFSGNPLLAP